MRWRWGSANLCGCQILREERQIWPYTLGEWFRSMALDTSWEDVYTLDTVPFSFDIHSYNLDDTFEHELWLGMNIVRPVVSTGLVAFLNYLLKGGKSE